MVGVDTTALIDAAMIGAAGALGIGVMTAVIIGPGKWAVRWIGRQIGEEVKHAVGDVVTERISPDLTQIRSQLEYNGGKSVKDMVRWLVEKVGGDDVPPKG
jgi:hypothetical protein